MYKETAAQCWAALEGMKTTLMDRIERYASLTIPKICLPEGFDTLSQDQTHDYQSIGAQAVNHLTNKAMLALFAPSRPFFRVAAGIKTLKELMAQGTTEADIAPAMAKMERDAVKELDARGQRPKLYQILRHLIVTGNVLMVLNKDDIRVMGMRYFCVKRDTQGKLHTLIIREEVKADELDDAVRAASPVHHDETKVSHYRYITRMPNGKYKMTQWINEFRLPEQFDGMWPENKMPYRVLTWDLSDESDYATGLVEEYAGDFEALSVLSESVVDGAVLGTEYRWLVNPTGMTSADDLNKSQNGDALPGVPADIAPTQGGNPAAIEIAERVLMRYERRVATGFLMLSGVQRDAERVTAEEVRLTAQELETAFGGVYSTLANNIQGPMATWLLAVAGTDISGLDLKVQVITGLDALSRNGDLENLRMAFSDLAQLTNLPEHLLGRVKFTPLAKFVGDGRGIDLLPFIMSDEEYQQQQAAQAQQRVAEQAAVAGGEAQAQQGMQ